MSERPTRVALVTGSTSGIGRAIAERLARDGIVVGINGRGADRVAAVVEELRASGYQAVAAPADVTQRAAVARMVADVAERAGGVDVLVNNAGGVHGVEASTRFEDFSDEAWRVVLDRNLTSVFLCSQAVVPYMKARGWGRIINVASESARVPIVPRVAGYAYASAKSGVLGLSRVLAAELAPFGITVNTVAPGFTRSGPRIENMFNSLPEERRVDRVRPIKLGRWAELGEIASAVAYLASDDASYVVGAVFDVNGGSFMP
jgi:NAD(P)-dependent dehydrogenase (short-subunit alcohol dehydrogenase family)